MLLSSGDNFPHLIQKRRSQLGFVTYLLNYPRKRPIKSVQNMKDHHGDKNNSKLFRVNRQFHKTATSDCQLRHVCLSIRLTARNNSAPNSGICRKFLILGIFRETGIKIHLSLKRDKNNNRHCTCSRPIYISDHISLSSSQNEKCFRLKL